MRGKWRLTCLLDFLNMKTLLQLLFAQKLISSKCVGLLFKNNLLPSDTVPLNSKKMAPNAYFGFLQYENFAAIIIRTEINIQ